MTSSGVSRYIISVSLTAMVLVGCGGSQPPIATPGAMPQSHEFARRPDRGRSWMAQGLQTTDLLYVSDYGNGIIVYKYAPPRLKYVGFLAEPQLGEGECVDKAQDVFITGSDYDIVEYAHGGTTPKAILTDPFALPLSCSSDPTTGNLAVVGYPDIFHQNYGAAIFKKARRKPTLYEDTGFAAFACAYDDKGNLFMDGSVTGGAAALAELPKGSSAFINIPLNQTFNGVGGIQWNAGEVAVGDYYNAVIYEFRISGSTAQEVGSTPLDGSGTVIQFFIDRDTAIVPSTLQNSSGYVKLYEYPSGGTARRTLDFGSPSGAVVSRAR
jgi:hypothetical protein